MAAEKHNTQQAGLLCPLKFQTLCKPRNTFPHNHSDAKMLWGKSESMKGLTMAVKKKAKKATQKAPAKKVAAKKVAKKTAKKAVKKPAKKGAKKAVTKPAPKTASRRQANTEADGIRQGDKAAYVRELPRSMPASEVVEKAAEKGMIISKAYVHNIRSAANKAARALMAKEGKKKVSGNKTKWESQFRELVIALGPARSKKLLSQVETSLSIAARR